MWPFNNKDKKLEQFSSDKCDAKTRFKALISIQSSISKKLVFYKRKKKKIHVEDSGNNAERKKWHEANCRQVFNVCRSALEEYAKNPSKKDTNFEDPQRVCDIINCLTTLCQDIAELLAQKWNVNANTELLTKLLHYQTNEQIRYDAITLAFVIINGCKDKAAPKYVQLLKHAIDFTCFCTEGGFIQYEKNFKQYLIICMWS
ncbi:hypothetical protein RFI_32912 [Reticulomyxa filosa]|uniref:Uncharacterized protein n=1 Tax=Reticulomyxa filosa TaxID=46433 RepID=X6LUT5_RETFI|nr:hypothetical protein RFI_32912 [Reticulomyxa filosa]|eukprot:ETO04485.1 hypothetical protein RFI_32912 [Reticulomyxa filosa]